MFRLMVGTLLVFCACSSGPELTKEERVKLDPGLTKLLSGNVFDEREYDVSTRPDGVKEYEVIIHTGKPDELRAAGIRLLSSFGTVHTARVTLSELRRILGMPAVLSVQNGSKNSPN